MPVLRQKVASGAVFSKDYRYRYLLTRGCGVEHLSDKESFVLFIMLNPSTATAGADDPTIRRCIGFALRYGFRRMAVVNLFALRTTYPIELQRADDPVGRDNDRWMKRVAAKADTIICAWGNHGGLRDRSTIVTKQLHQHRPLYCLGVTKQGHPMHPLRLAHDLKLKEYK
jgi:hypothetical protein